MAVGHREEKTMTSKLDGPDPRVRARRPDRRPRSTGPMAILGAAILSGVALPAHGDAMIPEVPLELFPIVAQPLLPPKDRPVPLKIADESANERIAPSKRVS
jgi:hypothetical protein